MADAFIGGGKVPQIGPDGKIPVEVIPDLALRIVQILGGQTLPLEAAKAAVTAALASASSTPAEGLPYDGFQVRYDDRADPILKVTEADGIVSKITHQARSVPAAALAADVAAGVARAGALVELDDSVGWAFAVYYAGTREVAFGIRTNGTIYPAPAVAPVAPTVLAPLQIDGDSIAAGWATNTAALTTATGRAAAVNGIGGQNGIQIAARRGSIPALLTVQGDTIPAAGAVAVTGKSVGLLDITADGTSSRVGSLAGVKGTLTAVRSGASHAYTFTRAAAGTAAACPPGTPFIPATNPDAYTILITGRNDIGQGAFRTPLDTILGNIEKQLNHAKRRDRVLLLSVLPRADEDRIGMSTRAVYEQLNDAYRTTFGAQFVDWGAFLRSEAAFAAAGISRTATDDVDIADGVTPAAFRNDILHPNTNGYKAANAFLPAVITSRDWT